MTHYNRDRSGNALQLNTLLSVFSQSPLRGKSRVQLIAIGLPEDVLQVMYRVHPCGIEVPLWSPPQPIPDTEEVVRIYIQNAGQNLGQRQMPPNKLRSRQIPLGAGLEIESCTSRKITFDQRILSALYRPLSA